MAQFIGECILTQISDTSHGPSGWCPGLMMQLQGFLVLYFCTLGFDYFAQPAHCMLPLVLSTDSLL